MKKSFQNILSFIVIFLIVNFIFSFFFKPPAEEQNLNTITVTAIHKDFEVGSVVSAEIKNNTKSPIGLKSTCPNEPLNVFIQQNGTWVQEHKQAEINCANSPDILINPGDKHTVSFSNWNHALFSATGQYKFQATILVDENAATTTTQVATQQSTQQIAATAKNPNIQPKTIESEPFEIKAQGWLGWFWQTFFYQPIYNVLIFIINFIPGHDLGFSIILLTLIIRTILLIPNHKALESQRKLQDIQPKLNHIKEKYKDNQEMIGKETLAIMQENKVNPLGSCLPLLIQFPILIGLFYVVQNGLNPDNSFLLYGPLQNFNFNTINFLFLGLLDLTKINLFVLPLIVGGLQFVQMKLALARTKKAQRESKEIAPKKKNEMDTASSMMLYFMPVMIAVFTASTPAGVGIYWSTSTLYGIGQQIAVNRKADSAHSKVKVIN